jgi:hypothetical protein
MPVPNPSTPREPGQSRREAQTLGDRLRLLGAKSHA